MLFKRKSRSLLILIFLFVILFLIWIGSRPSRGKIITKPAENSPQKTITPPKQYQGDFLSFYYDANYSLRFRPDPPESSSQKLELLAEPGNSNHWVIAVNDITVSDLSEVSAVQFRRLNPDLYLEKDIKIDDLKGLFFRKKDINEFLFLVIKDGKMVTISLTNKSNDTTSEQAFIDFVSQVEIK